MSVPTKDKPYGDGLPPKRALGVKEEMVFRAVLAREMDLSGKNRAQIASEMSRILGCPTDRLITKNMLDDCVRSRKTGRVIRFPAAWVAALCEAIGRDGMQRHLLNDRLRGLLMIGENVSESARSLKRAQEAVEKIMELKR